MKQAAEWGGAVFVVALIGAIFVVRLPGGTRIRRSRALVRSAWCWCS